MQKYKCNNNEMLNTTLETAGGIEQRQKWCQKFSISNNF